MTSPASSEEKLQGCHFFVIVPLMARPRIIDPSGEVVRLNVSMDSRTAAKLEREAKRRGVSVSAVIREKLAQAS